MIEENPEIKKTEYSLAELEKFAIDNENVNFIELPKGRLVVFNPDRFVWNAYGKSSIDRENVLTDEQWHDFKSSEKYMFLELDHTFSDELNDYCKENNIK